MLVLSRRPNESIVVTTPAGERIEIMALGGKGDRQRWGITARREIHVTRKELLPPDPGPQGGGDDSDAGA